MGFSATVLQVIPALEAGGAERTTVEIAKAVIAAGGQALVATRGGRLAADIEAAGGKVFPMPVHAKNPIVLRENRNRLLKLIREQKVDIVHARSRAPAWSALWASRAAGVAFVTTYHGAYRGGSGLKRLYNSSMIRGDRVIANSGFTAAAIRAQHEIPARRLVVIPRGADLDAFDPESVGEKRMEALSARWGVNHAPGALRLLLPARLTAWKGHMTAIDAAARLQHGAVGAGQRVHLQLIFVGDAQGGDSYPDALRREIETRGVRDMVHLVGHCADMPAAYRWADVVLAPSTRPEAFGRVAVEAGAMRKPVIATDHGGARETVLDGETGFLVPPGDAVALSEAIADFAAMTPDARRDMGLRAQARIETRFSAAAMCAATLDVYKDLLRG